MSLTPPAISVDLDREFAPISEQEFEGGWRRAIARVTGRVRGWSQLTQRVVVILGESGSGKTAEIAIRAAALRTQGKHAFAFRLADVVARSQQQVIGRDWEAFELWLDSGDEATFLLDGLDEAKAASDTIERILDTLTSWMPTAARRVRLVISVRPSEWEPVADLARVRAVLAGWAPDRSEDSDVVVVSLFPLDIDRARRYARALGVTDDEVFAETAKLDGLDQFMERPLDVAWLASRWKAEGRFGPLRTMIDSHITERLSDRRTVGRAVNLPIDRARAGAQRLAAVATLSATTSFPIRDGATAAEIRQHPLAILSDWRRDEVLDLLLLPIFDEGTPTTLRIHVKDVQEYLCAEWLREQLRTNLLTIDRVIALLFRPDGRTFVVPPHLVRVAAWLAHDELYVREQLIEHAPHQLLDEGDPAALPLAARERALRAYARRFAERDRTDIRFDRRGLRRFASPELSPIIDELIQDAEGEDVRATLLDIVAAGGLGGSAGLALQIALAPDTTNHVRYAAIRAAARAGSPAQRTALAALAATPDCLDLDATGTLVATLFPDPVTPALLRTLLTSAAPKGRWNRVTRLDRALLEEVPRRCPPGDRVHVIETLRQAVDASHDDWLVRPMVELLALHLEHVPSDISRTEVQDALTRLDTEDHRWDSFDTNLERLTNLAAASEAARRSLLRWSVERSLAAGDELSPFALQRALFVGRVLTASDLRWLAQQVPAAADAASAAASILDKPRVELVVGAPEPRRSFSARALEQMIEHLDEIRAGHARFLELCVRPYASGSDWGSLAFDRMRQELAADAFDAIRAGLTRIWHEYDVPVPRERHENSTPGEVRLGLMGLGLDFAEGLDAASLDEGLAKRVARFALWELNHFPPWFGRLLAAHPTAVTAEVVAEALGELRDGRGRERVLHKAFRGPAPLPATIAQEVQTMVLVGSVALSTRLESAIELLLQTNDIDSSGWARLIRERFAASTIEDDLETLLWAFQFRVDAPGALDRLDARVASNTEDDRVSVRALLDALWSWLDRTGIDLRFDVPTMTRLYTSIVLYGADGDSPFASPRRLRAELVGDLEKAGRAGRDAFLQLAARDDPPFLPLRDFHHAAAGRAVLGDPSAAPLSRDNAIEWVRSHEIVPQTDDGLFDLVLARLADIATFLRAHRFSYAGVFVNLKGERAVRERYFQLWLAAELQLRAARRYEIVREEEEYAEKRPDLRAHLTTITPTSIEIKVVESWTLPQLRSALADQLVGQYMSQVGSRHGVLALCTTRHSKTWRGEDGSVVKLDDLVDVLRSDAEAMVQAGTSNVRRLAIVVLDFRGPASSPTQARRGRKMAARPSPATTKQPATSRGQAEKPKKPEKERAMKAARKPAKRLAIER